MTVSFSAMMIFALLLCAVMSSAQEQYGVDTSFPAHYLFLNDVNPLGVDHRVQAYRHFVDGCYAHYSKAGTAKRCYQSEEMRIGMNLKQPPKMTNFTSAGYAKVPTPLPLLQQLQAYYKEHTPEPELWPAGNTYTNHWESPTSMMPLTPRLQAMVIDALQPILEQWTGQPLVATSVYGIRVYPRHAVLAPHVDRLPLVTSAILNIAQEDMDEPWPLEVIAHDGVAVNITAEPGDLILYESHSIVHGRPFALQGKSYASVFCHFEPFGYTERHAASKKKKQQYLQRIYQEAQEEQSLLELDKNPNPPDYVKPENAYKWRQEYVYNVEKKQPKDHNGEEIKSTAGEHVKVTNVVPKTASSNNKSSSVTAHRAAALGQLSVLEKMAKDDPSLLTKRDRNGWQPLHEAARSGETETIKFLVKHGADVNERTNHGRGGTPLFWAEQLLDPTHPTVVFLKKQGAKNIPPRANGKEAEENE